MTDKVTKPCDRCGEDVNVDNWRNHVTCEMKVTNPYFEERDAAFKKLTSDIAYDHPETRTTKENDRAAYNYGHDKCLTSGVVKEMADTLEYYAKGRYPTYTKNGVKPGQAARNILSRYRAILKELENGNG